MANESFTVVLTSKQNFVWTSMQEIIPMIEECWQSSAVAGQHAVQVVDTDIASFKEVAQIALKADQVVLTCFTVRLARLAECIRSFIKPSARLVIYLHNQATIGCWPLFRWGVGQGLRSTDLFISSCTADARALRLSFPNATVGVIPFTFSKGEGVDLGRRLRQVPLPPFVFSGRISEQKNLACLIEAFEIYRSNTGDCERALIFYGGEDHLGSPNMGIPAGNYLVSLKSLVQIKKLTEQVLFKGRLERSVLHQELASEHILVSPSLHSDENFGMSAFRSLVLGAPAVLSNWGGHIDFAKHFGSQVELVPVRGSTVGPWMSPKALAVAMQRATKIATIPSHLPDYYSRPEIVRQLQWLGENLHCETPQPLLRSSLQQELVESQQRFLKEDGKMTKIFSSYEDPRSHEFFRAYGMEQPVEQSIRKGF